MKFFSKGESSGRRSSPSSYHETSSTVNLGVWGGDYIPATVSFTTTWEEGEEAKTGIRGISHSVNVMQLCLGGPSHVEAAWAERKRELGLSHNFGARKTLSQQASFSLRFFDLLAKSMCMDFPDLQGHTLLSQTLPSEDCSATGSGMGGNSYVGSAIPQQGSPLRQGEDTTIPKALMYVLRGKWGAFPLPRDSSLWLRQGKGM